MAFHVCTSLLWICGIMAVCGAEWIQRDEHVYYFSDNRLTWSAAQDDCESRGANLVTVNNEIENYFLLRVRLRRSEPHWIGLHCPNESICHHTDELKWVNGDSGYRYYEIDRPSYIRYVFIEGRIRRWRATEAKDTEYRYICEKPDGCYNPDNPCENGGTCEGTNGYECDCDSTGYGGPMCEHDIDECGDGSHGCVTAHGQCSNAVGGFYCLCESGYTGAQCEIDVNECALYGYCGDGDCINTYGGYRCQCPRGYTGQNCTDDIDECLDDTACSSRGQYFYMPGEYACACGQDFYGGTCQSKIVKAEPGTKFTDTPAAIVLITVTVILLLLLCGTALFIIATRQQWITRFRSSQSPQTQQTNTSPTLSGKEAIDQQDISVELDHVIYENTRHVTTPQQVEVKGSGLDACTYEELGPALRFTNPSELDASNMYTSLQTDHANVTR